MVKKTSIVVGFVMPLMLTGCGFSGGIGALNGGNLLQGAVTGALNGIAPILTDDQILFQHVQSHNLKVQLEQIDQSPGVVNMQMNPSTVGAPSSMPTMIPAPNPTPVATPPMPSSGNPTIVTPTP